MSKRIFGLYFSLFIFVLLAGSVTAAPQTYYLCGISTRVLQDTGCTTISLNSYFAGATTVQFATSLTEPLEGNDYTFDLYMASATLGESPSVQVDLILLNEGLETPLASTSFVVSHFGAATPPSWDTILYTDTVTGIDASGAIGDQLILNVTNQGPGQLILAYGTNPSQIRVSDSTTSLPAPTSLTATPLSGTTTQLTWMDNALDETSYYVERSLDGVSWAVLGSVAADTTSVQVINQLCETPYFFRVRAYRAGDGLYSDYSNTASAVTLTCVLPAPSSLGATVISATETQLTWVDNAIDESNYAVEISYDNNNWIEIGVTNANITSVNIINLTCNTQYYYRVRAYRGSDDVYSAYSNVATATTTACSPPAAPTGLTATAVSQTQINLSWTDNASDETEFRIERSLDGSTDWIEIATVGANTVSYHNNNLISSTAYYYRIRAYRSAGNSFSGYSSVANTMTFADVPASGAETYYLCGISTKVLSETECPGLNLSLVGALNERFSVNLAGDISSTEYTFDLYLATATVGASAEAQVNLILDQGGVETVLAATSFTVSHYGGTGPSYTAILFTDTVAGIDPAAIAGDTLILEIVNRGPGALVLSYGGKPSKIFFSETPAPLAAPTQLSAVAISQTEVELVWTDNAIDETNYIIERTLSGSNNWMTVNALMADETSYNDPNLLCHKTYLYRVSAYRATDGTYSDYSNTATVQTHDCSDYEIFLPALFKSPPPAEPIMISTNLPSN